VTHISVLLYTTSPNFFVQGNQHTTNRVSIAIVYHGDANGSSFIEANGFVFYFVKSAITNP